MKVCIGASFYHVRFVDPDQIEGKCGLQIAPAEGQGGQILLNNNMTGHMLLDTLLHETIHVLCPYLDENTVVQIGSCLATVLLETGFAKEEDLCQGIKKKNSTKRSRKSANMGPSQKQQKH